MGSYDKQDPRLGKKGPCTSEAQSEGSKHIKCEMLPSIGTPATLGKAAFNASDKVAGSHRIYDRDYSKVRPEKDDVDEITPALGNPLRW